MPSLLIIEDGSGVPNANSYVSAANARIYASSRQFNNLPADDPTCEGYLLQATTWLEAQYDRYQGQQTAFTQALQWPRMNVFINDPFNPLAVNVIPPQLIAAQVMLAVNVASGVVLFPTRSQPFVKTKKVGPLEKEFSEIIGTLVTPTMTMIEALLKPLFWQKTGGGTLTATRV
jgi:hypothetical protein